MATVLTGEARREERGEQRPEKEETQKRMEEAFAPYCQSGQERRDREQRPIRHQDQPSGRRGIHCDQQRQYANDRSQGSSEAGDDFYRGHCERSRTRRRRALLAKADRTTEKTASSRRSFLFRLAKLIEIKGLSQRKAAALTGIAQPDLSKLLRGHFSGFSMDRLVQAILALGSNVEIRAKKPTVNRRGRARVMAEAIAKTKQ